MMPRGYVRPTLDRNDIIATLAADGRYQLAEIGRLFGISRQRVDQLFRSKEHAARKAVMSALADGTLARAERCAECQRKRDDIQAHHPNYNEPLVVEWLCVPCHSNAHKASGGVRHAVMPRVQWSCVECGAERDLAHNVAAKRRFCSRACRSAFAAKREPERFMHSDGHYWIRGGGLHMRAERYIAMRALGRQLKRNEWVVLADANPENLDPSNILILTPQQVMAVRDGRADAARTGRSVASVIEEVRSDFSSIVMNDVAA